MKEEQFVDGGKTDILYNRLEVPPGEHPVLLYVSIKWFGSNEKRT